MWPLRNSNKREKPPRTQEMSRDPDGIANYRFELGYNAENHQMNHQDFTIKVREVVQSVFNVSYNIKILNSEYHICTYNIMLELTSDVLSVLNTFPIFDY